MHYKTCEQTASSLFIYCVHTAYNNIVTVCVVNNRTIPKLLGQPCNKLNILVRLVASCQQVVLNLLTMNYIITKIP